MTLPRLAVSNLKFILFLLTTTVFILAVACGPAAPAPNPAPASSQQVNAEEIRSMIESAVQSSNTPSVSREEMRSMVEGAVADANSGSELSPDELEAIVAAAVSEAVAAQQPATSQPPAETPAIEASEPESIVLTDIAGRTLTIEMPVERIILGEARQIYIAAALQPGNPFNKIIGWRNDLRRFDADTYNKYKEAFPEVADVPEFGSPYSGDFSVERAIALEADVVTIPLGGLERAREAGMIDQLAEVGIPVVVIDYREFPLENTVPSTILLGRLFGQEERAQEIVDFYLQEVNKVFSVVERGIDAEPPVVLLDRAAGIQSAENCCGTFGRANLGLMIERAGGINLGTQFIPGWSGNLNPEQILVSDPDIIIATGSNWFTYNPEGDFVSLGYFTEPEDARARLKALGEGRPGWTELAAIKEGKHYAVWHQFYNTPYNFVVLQQFAKWFYPEAFADMDPTANFAEFHDRFLPIDYSGAFFVSARE